jgi:hypothetical protein
LRFPDQQEQGLELEKTGRRLLACGRPYLAPRLLDLGRVMDVTLKTGEITDGAGFGKFGDGGG